MEPLITFDEALAAARVANGPYRSSEVVAWLLLGTRPVSPKAIAAADAHPRGKGIGTRSAANAVRQAMFGDKPLSLILPVALDLARPYAELHLIACFDGVGLSGAFGYAAGFIAHRAGPLAGRI